MQVWKYVLKHGTQQVKLPAGSITQFVAGQYNNTCVWVRVDPEQQATETREFLVVNTGEDFEGNDLRYLGSAMLHEGNLVKHVYERVGFQELIIEAAPTVARLPQHS